MRIAQADRERYTSVSMTPGTIDQAMQLAVQNHQAGRLADAEKICRQVLAKQSSHAGALHLLGLIAYQVGRLDESVDLIRRAIASDPRNPSCSNNLGIILKSKGALNEAIAAYRQALQINPEYAEAYSNLGVALHSQGKLDEAIAACRQAVRLQPNYADAYSNLGVSLIDNGQVDEAIIAHRQAICLKPNYAEAHNNLGVALYKNREFDEAIASCLKAISLSPDNAEAHNNLGNALRDKGELDEAIAAFSKAVRLKPDYAAAHHNLGMALSRNGQFDQAIVACRQAIQLKPDFGKAYNSLGIALFRIGELDEAIAACRTAARLEPDSDLLQSGLIFILHYHHNSTAQMLLDETMKWVHLHADPLMQFIRPHRNDRSPDRRLKIGYVSPDFRDHPVGRFVLPLLAAHDPAQVELFTYGDVAHPDAITERIRSHIQHWHETTEMTDQQLAEKIFADQIDILIDIAGHTKGNRLLAFARKPAPVQATWLGYPNTTGLATMDYRLTDALADPPGAGDALYTERLIRLPHVAWCYTPHTEHIAPNEEQLTAKTPIVFGSFNNFSKITTPMLELWAQIVHSTPNSKLLIKAKVFGCQSVLHRVRKIMEASGVTSDRLELQEWKISHEEHLESYRQVHIALDTFPYHGTTTTCEALWMGVPVITLAGTTHLSRVGVSLLSNAGLPELIAQSPEQYVQLAVGLAKDADRLNHLRTVLRNQMRTSPLMDASGFARDVESAYRQMWQSWCAQPHM